MLGFEALIASLLSPQRVDYLGCFFICHLVSRQFFWPRVAPNSHSSLPNDNTLRKVEVDFQNKAHRCPPIAGVVLHYYASRTPRALDAEARLLATRIREERISMRVSLFGHRFGQDCMSQATDEREYGFHS